MFTDTRSLLPLNKYYSNYAVTIMETKCIDSYCVKCPYSEFFWFVFSRIQSEYGKIQTRKTPNMDTFYAVSCITILTSLHFLTTLAKYILLERASVRISLLCGHRQTRLVNIHICVHTSLYTETRISQSVSLETSELLLLR